MQSFNIFDMWGHMGGLDKFIVVLLAGMSMYSIWIMIDRFLAFRKTRAASRHFLTVLRERLRGNDLQGARAAAKADTEAPVARLVEAVLDEYEPYASRFLKAGDDVDLDVMDALQREATRVKDGELARMKRGLGGLASISSASPFIGLFGTVIGIINAFRSMAESGQGGLGAVSAGISEALFTTAAGLVVAIPALMAFNYFTHLAEDFALGMNDVSGPLMNHLVRQAKTQQKNAA